MRFRKRVSPVSPAFILIVTFISAYVPTIYAVLSSPGSDPIAALKKPDVIGGLMGLLFSVLLSIGESNYANIKKCIEDLNQKIAAQSHGHRLQEAYLKSKEGPYSPLFGNLAEIRLERIHSDLQDMMEEQPFYMVRQNDPVQEYIDIFVQLMLKIIHPGSEFRVITNELIWSKNSFGGPDRRYLLANYIAAKDRAVKVDRIFMTMGRAKLREDVQSAKSLLEILKDHERTLHGPGVEVDLSVYEVESDHDYHGFFRNPSNNFAIWNVSEDHRICTVVEYSHTSEGSYKIRGFKFDSNPMLIMEKSAVFEDLRKKAKSLEDYIESLEALIKEIESPKPVLVGAEETKSA